MRRVFTTAEALADGLTKRQLEYAAETGVHMRITRGIYAEGGEPLDVFTEALGRMRANPGYAWGDVAGILHGLDSVEVTSRKPKRRRIECELSEVKGYLCTTGLGTICDLSLTMDDIAWEHSFESGLRQKLFAVDDVARSTSERIQRVLALRPPGAAPTGSLLETLAVQLIRSLGLPDPVRQYVVYSPDGQFVARLDLAWPELGLFLELDGRDHDKQQDYDVTRETRVVAATGWLCGRFRWRHIHDLPNWSGRQIVQLYEQASKTRPRPSTDADASARILLSRP